MPTKLEKLIELYPKRCLNHPDFFTDECGCNSKEMNKLENLQNKYSELQVISDWLFTEIGREDEDLELIQYLSTRYKEVFSKQIAVKKQIEKLCK